MKSVTESDYNYAEIYQDISIEKTPNPDMVQCQITINMPWEIAKGIAKIAAPFLACLSKSVELRAKKEIERSISMEKTRRDIERRNALFNSAVLSTVREMFQNDLICYSDFISQIERRAGGNISRVKPFSIRKSRLRLLWRRMRVYVIQGDISKGITPKQIAINRKLPISTVYSIKGVNRRCLK